MLATDGGDAEQVTDLPHGAGAPVWSPDGTRLALCATVGTAGDPLVARRLNYQADGAGLYGAARQQLHVVDLASGECRQVTDGDEHAGGPAWSPDSSTIAFVRKVGDDSDLTYRTAVHLVDAADRKAEPRVVAFAGGVAATVSFARDGASLLVVGHPGDPVGHQHLVRVPLDGGEPISLTAHLDRNVMPGGTAYPGGRPQEAGDGRLLLCPARPRLHPPVGARRRRGPAARRRRPRGLRASRWSAAPRSSPSARPRRTARSWRSTSPPAPRPC